MEAVQSLLAAGKNYSLCARLIETKLAISEQPNSVESERLIAFGIAADWTRRAACLQPLTYVSKLMDRSNRSPLVTELVRFNFSWAGINALFARKAVLDLLGTSRSASEFDKFMLLYTSSCVPDSKAKAYETILHRVLNTPVVTRLPGIAPGTPVTTLHSLHFKYTPIEAQTKGIGKRIGNALVGRLVRHLP